MSDAVPNRGRLAGIDFGTVRLGIALSDPGQVLSSPHEMLQRGTTSEEAGFFQRLVDRSSIVESSQQDVGENFTKLFAAEGERNPDIPTWLAIPESRWHDPDQGVAQTIE